MSLVISELNMRRFFSTANAVVPDIVVYASVTSFLLTDAVWNFSISETTPARPPFSYGSNSMR